MLRNDPLPVPQFISCYINYLKPISYVFYEYYYAEGPLTRPLLRRKRDTPATTDGECQRLNLSSELSDRSWQEAETVGAGRAIQAPDVQRLEAAIHSGWLMVASLTPTEHTLMRAFRERF